LAAHNGPIHKVRCRVEKIFGTCKRSSGLDRIPSCGLDNATLFVHLTAIAYDLKRGLSLQRQGQGWNGNGSRASIRDADIAAMIKLDDDNSKTFD
jgi:hypothetical protein